MDTHGWGTDHPVEELLFREGYRFEFYQAVRLLELLYPRKIGVGETIEPDREAVRFRSRLSLEFPAGEIADIEPARDGGPATVTVNFMGLGGTFGPLPFAYTELALRRVSLKDTAMRDFFDLFNHRLVSLMHRIRKLHRVGMDSNTPEQSHLARYFFSFAGLGTGGLHNRMEVPDRSFLFYTGQLLHRPRSVVGLVTMLSDYFDTAVHARPMAGRWLRIDPDQTTAVGLHGRNNELGRTVVLGSRVWDQPGRFALRIGPLPLETAITFLPGESAHDRLKTLVRFYAGDEQDFTLTLLVDPASIKGVMLGRESPTRLGWTTWLAPGISGGQAFSIGVTVASNQWDSRTAEGTDQRSHINH